MYRIFLAISLLFLSASKPALAESCDACPDACWCEVSGCVNGCMAIYWPDDDNCTALCTDPDKTKQSGGRVSATIKNAPRTIIENKLEKGTGVSKQPKK